MYKQHDTIPQRTKNSTHTLLDTIKSFSNVAGYRINLQKSLTFPYTNNEQTEKEYMETIPLRFYHFHCRDLSPP
jgi:hypothetical protein